MPDMPAEPPGLVSERLGCSTTSGKIGGTATPVDGRLPMSPVRLHGKFFGIA
jgi:hypothetical protein